MILTDELDATVQYPRLRRLLADWDRWRGHRRMPNRHDFLPEQLGYILGYLVLYDVVEMEPPRFRYRLVGTAISERRGFDMTGRFVDEHHQSQVRIVLSSLNEQVARERRPMWCEFGPLETVFDLKHCGMLSLPLSNDGATVDMILAAQIFLSQERRIYPPSSLQDH